MKLRIKYKGKKKYVLYILRYRKRNKILNEDYRKYIENIY